MLRGRRQISRGVRNAGTGERHGGIGGCQRDGEETAPPALEMVTVGRAGRIVDQHRAGAARATRGGDVFTACHKYEVSVLVSVRENLLGRARGNAVGDLNTTD